MNQYFGFEESSEDPIYRDFGFGFGKVEIMSIKLKCIKVSKEQTLEGVSETVSFGIDREAHPEKTNGALWDVFFSGAQILSFQVFDPKLMGLYTVGKTYELSPCLVVAETR